MVSPERRQEVDAFITTVKKWAGTRSDLAAVGVVGFWARGAERQDSDVVRDGLRAVYDPWGLLAELATACGGSR